MAIDNTPGDLKVVLGLSKPQRVESDQIVIYRQAGARPEQELVASFQRTVRVSDNGGTNDLPPSLGSFPLYATSDVSEIPPAHVTSKGGFLIPLYQREAMWINFTASCPFAIKIYVGGVNAISGEPTRETGLTMMRRLDLMKQKRTIQDYVVAPKQLWLDGIASADGTVRQFVAMPLGEGYSIEAQVTGEELVGGLQFDITPSKMQAPPLYRLRRSHLPADAPHFTIQVLIVSGTRILFSRGIPERTMSLFVDGRHTNRSETLKEADVQGGHMLECLKGQYGGGFFEQMDLGIAAGGLIRQTVVRDDHDPVIWDAEHSTIFNVQILNTAHFHQITGMQPPSTPVTAEAYAKHGFPYFKLYDEKPSGIKGDFAGVKSVNEMDIERKPSTEKAKAVAEVIKSNNNPVVLLNATGQRVGFRPLADMEKDVRERFAGIQI